MILSALAQDPFFLDYLATEKLEIEKSAKIVEGIVAGCKQAGCALIGGETAEMPGMYQDGRYDLAGFSVGEVYKNLVIDGKKCTPGDTIIALASSGFHSNGYSLVRKLIKNDETGVKTKCLTPTKIYVKSIMALLKKFPKTITGTCQYHRRRHS